MFVLVFFQMYIIHGIAQLYANYNNGEEGVDTTSDQETPSSNQQPLGSQHPQSKPEIVRDMFLPRRDGVKVNNLYRH